MNPNDTRVLYALKTDLAASLRLRQTSFRCCGLNELDSATRSPSEFFWREYAAVEQFIAENFCGCDKTFNPQI